MRALFSNLLTASVSGSIVILAVLVLRLVLRKTPKKFICMLWMVAGLRLLLPVPLQSRFSLQPPTIRLPQSETLQTYLVPLWCIVAVSLLCASLISYAHLRRQVKDARKIRGGWECEGLETAFVLGFLKPKIYIPAGINDNTRQQILAHERTHLDKGDHWIKLIGFLALVLHWFNPLVWVSYILLCKDIEMACDQRVVQFMDLPERKAYSAALLDCSTHKVHYAACPVAFGEVSVKYRIKSVLSYKKPAFWISLLGVLAIAFVAVCLGTNPIEQRSDPDAALLRSSRETPEDFTPAVLPQSEENPDWGLEMSVADLTPTGGSLMLGITEKLHLATENLKLSDSFLETWNGESWEPLPSRSGDGQVIRLSYGFGGSFDRSSEICCEPMDWSAVYGSLAAGDYRIVVTVTDDTRTDLFRVPFHIYREALPSAQEAAVARCENALSTLENQLAFVVRRSEKNFLDDGLSPVCQVGINGREYRVDYFAGEFPVSTDRGSVNGYIREGLVNSELASFSLNRNRKFLFPEGDSLISDGEIRFRSVWTDQTGNICQGTDQYLFDETGSLKQIDRLEQSIDGEILLHQRLEVLSTDPYSSYISSAPSLDYTDSYTSGGDSPWSIYLRVDDDLLTPTGGYIYVSWQGVGAGNYTMGDSYWLERKVQEGKGTDGWQRILGSDAAFPFGVALDKLSSRAQIFHLDWSDAYGSLDAGVYRLGTRFYKDDQSIIQYAEFAVYPTGGYYGDGAQAAMARVDAAIEKLKSGSYHAKKFQSLGRQGTEELVLTEEFWQYGDTLVTAMYYDAGRYSHCAVETGDDRIMDGWYGYTYFSGPYDSFYFPAGQSVISDREITFLYSYSTAADDNPLTRYTYRFDESGNLTEIEHVSFDSMYNGYRVKCIIEPTPEAEIRAQVEAYRQEYEGK